jgi:CRP/FNR family transcriptional regulator, cyclic AMP receptor protein
MLRLDPDDRRLLFGSGWLSACPPAFGEAVVQRCRVQSLDPGETLYRAGDPSDAVVAVLSGAIALSVHVPEFGPTVSHVMLPGAWFGEVAYIELPRAISVHATRPTRVAMLSRRDIDEIIREDTSRWVSFSRLAILNGLLAVGAAYDLMQRDPRRRCIATLLRLAGARHGLAEPAGRVEIDITQSDLAHMANLSRNTVAAILKELRQARCIEWEYRRLLITDIARLKALLGDGA